MNAIIKKTLAISLTMMILVGCSNNPANSKVSSDTTTANSSSQVSKQEMSSDMSSDTASKSDGEWIFDEAVLAKFNGKKGNAAYIAVDGTIYDVSSCFVEGEHNGFSAGKDLTEAFNGEHSAAFLDGCPVVGTLGAVTTGATSSVVSSKEETPSSKETSSADKNKLMTKDELAKFNGQNKNPSYIAVEGVIYDVSAFFKDGKHNGATAGGDRTKEFYDEHSLKKLNSCPVMGKLDGYVADPNLKKDDDDDEDDD